MYGMEAARFSRLVQHLHNYGGAVAAANQVEEGDPVPMPATPQLMPPPAAMRGARVIGASVAELKTSDIGDLFSIGRSGG